MFRKTALFLTAIICSLVFSQNISAEETPSATTKENKSNPDSSIMSGYVTVQKQSHESQPAGKNYSINFSLRIFDDSNSPILNSSWSRVTVSGKPVSVNLKASNLQIAAVFIPYYVDETSLVLLTQGKVMLKPVNLADGKYFSTVDSLPLRIGEKALFFPLGLIEEKMENISSCVLEIEVLHYDKIGEPTKEENFLLEPGNSQERTAPERAIKK